MFFALFPITFATTDESLLLIKKTLFIYYLLYFSYLFQIVDVEEVTLWFYHLEKSILCNELNFQCHVYGHLVAAQLIHTCLSASIEDWKRGQTPLEGKVKGSGGKKWP